MDTAGFLLVIATGIGVILISLSLDYLWARIIPVRLFYYIVRAPGVVVHECAHILGCLITGAKIRNVVLFSREGGSVTHNPPVIPVIGDVVISTAPLFCIPLALALCTYFFSDYLGCVIPALPLTFNSANSFVVLGGGILVTFSRNLVVQFNAWFLLYLYLVLSLVLSAAPSMQDIRNAAIGISIMVITGLLILWSQYPLAVNAFTEIMRIMAMGFGLGLGFGLIALVLSSPLILIFFFRRIA
jgi:hypothetical protein